MHQTTAPTAGRDGRRREGQPNEKFTGTAAGASKATRRYLDGLDRHDLRRFVTAQDPVYDRVKAELARGAKASHWMWFVFPQLRGLGRSATSERYGIASAAEARAYWEHPVLGPRLKECVDLVLGIEGRTASQVFGSPDDLKLRSSLTLFERVAPEEPVFAQALEKYFGGERDPLTLSMLG